jgi:hypothetical protein
LIAELQQLENAEAFASWAHRALPLKNQLATTDAQTLEAAFVARLSEIEESEALPRSKSQKANSLDHKPLRADPGDQAVIVIGKPVRERDRDHLRFVASQPCLVCGRTPSDAHHIKFAEQRAIGRKVGDRFTVPICRLHHRELHRKGNERVWWQNQGIDALTIAVSLWASTHAVAPAEAEIVGARDQSGGINTRLNGRHFGNRADCADRLQNDETKPIRGSEAG